MGLSIKLANIEDYLLAEVFELLLTKAKIRRFR